MSFTSQTVLKRLILLSLAAVAALPLCASFPRGYNVSSQDPKTQRSEIRGQRPEVGNRSVAAQAFARPTNAVYSDGTAEAFTYAANGLPLSATRTGRLPTAIRSLSRDEYPFASSLEGGGSSWVGHVPMSQQNAQGALLKNFFKQNNINPGDQYRVTVGD